MLVSGEQLLAHSQSINHKTTKSPRLICWQLLVVYNWYPESWPWFSLWLFRTRVLASVSNFWKQGDMVCLSSTKAPTVSCNFSDSRTLKWAKFVPTCKNRQNTAPVWNSGSSIHVFNCQNLELHLECCLALHWFNKRGVAMLASPTGIKFFRNRFRDTLLASGMTSLQNESYQREALTENGSRLQRTDSMPQ